MRRRAVGRRPLFVAVSARGHHRRTATDHPTFVGPSQIRHLHRVRHQRESDLPDDGDYAPGSGRPRQSRTTYDLYNGQSVTLGSSTDSCTTSAPSTELACATIDPDAVVTQLAYNSAGDLTSKSTPDGNSGGELSTTTYAYDSDGEQTSSVAPDGNLSGANAANYTTTSTYDGDGDVTSVSVGGASGHSVVPRTTLYTL